MGPREICNVEATCVAVNKMNELKLTVPSTPQSMQVRIRMLLVLKLVTVCLRELGT